MELKRLISKISAECDEIVTREATKLQSEWNTSRIKVISIGLSKAATGKVRRLVKNLDPKTARQIAQLRIEQAVSAFVDEIYMVISNRPSLAIHYAQQVTEAYATDRRQGDKNRGYARLLAHGLPPEREFRHSQWLLHLARRAPELLEKVLDILFVGGYWLYPDVRPQVTLPWNVEHIYFPASQDWAQISLRESVSKLGSVAQQMTGFLQFCQQNEAVWQQEIKALSARIKQEAHRALRPNGEDHIALNIGPIRFTDGFERLVLLPRDSDSPLDIDIGFAGTFWGQSFQWTAPLKVMEDDRSTAYHRGAVNGWHCCHFFRWLITKTLARILIGDQKQRSKPRERVGTGTLLFSAHDVRSHPMLLPDGKHPNPDLVARGKGEIPYYDWDTNPNATFVPFHQKGRSEGTGKPVATFVW